MRILRCVLLLVFLISGLVNSYANDAVFIWSGAITDTSAKITVKVQYPSMNLRFKLANNSNFNNPFFTNFLASDTSNHPIYTANVNGLNPNTKYYYLLEDNGLVCAGSMGSFTTASHTPISFRFATGSCSTSGNHVVFDVINSMSPRFMIFTGDLHYYDPNSFDINAHRIPYSNTLSQPKINNMLKNVPIAYVWDDHDFTCNNCDGTSIGKSNAIAAYQQNVPHYPLQANYSGGGIYQSFEYGRLRFVLSDLRSERLMLQNIMSVQQMNWIKNEMLLAKMKKQFIVWISSVSFTGTNQLDGWAEFPLERTDLSNFMRDSSIANLMIISGDAHMLAIDDGTNNHYTTGPINLHQYPILQAAALNRIGSIKGGTFSNGVFPNPTFETGQFGIVDVIDNGGDSICINLTGMRTDSIGVNISAVTSYSFCRNLSIDLVVSKEINSKDKKELFSITKTDGGIIITNITNEMIYTMNISLVNGQNIWNMNNVKPNDSFYVPVSESKLLLIDAHSNQYTAIKKFVN